MSVLLACHCFTLLLLIPSIGTATSLLELDVLHTSLSYESCRAWHVGQSCWLCAACILHGSSIQSTKASFAASKSANTCIHQLSAAESLSVHEVSVHDLSWSCMSPLVASFPCCCVQGFYRKPGLRPPGGPTPYPSMPPHWARYPAFANPSNPNAAAFLDTASSSAAGYGQSPSSPVGYGQSSLPQQLAGYAAVMPSSSGVRLTPTAGPHPQIPVHHSPSSFQQSGIGGQLKPNAAPYYPSVSSASGPPTPVNSSNPYSQQQQHLQQYTGRPNLSNPTFSVQPLEDLGMGYPNAVSGRMGHQARVSAGGYPGYTGAFEPGSQQTQHNQQGLENSYPTGEVGTQHQHHFGVGFLHHPHHSKDKLVVPMDWHMDVLAGKTPSTFSPLGDQAMSPCFPPISEPITAAADYTTMGDQSMCPSFPSISEPIIAGPDYTTMEHELNPSSGPKQFTQHAFRVSTQKFAQGNFSPPNSSLQQKTLVRVVGLCCTLARAMGLP